MRPNFLYGKPELSWPTLSWHHVLGGDGWLLMNTPARLPYAIFMVVSIVMVTVI
jgi:hypothetical protein